jgi:hypothetical protein
MQKGEEVSKVLERFCERVPVCHTDHLMAVARSMQSGYLRDGVLTGLALRVAEHDTAAANSIVAMLDSYAQGRALVKLAAQTAALGNWRQALAWSEQSGYSQYEALEAAMPHLPPEALEQAAPLFRDDDSPAYEYGKALTAYAFRWADLGQPGRALLALTRLRDSTRHEGALSDLAARLGGTAYDAEWLQAIEGIRDPYLKAKALAGSTLVAGRTEKALVIEAMSYTTEVETSERRVELWRTLASRACGLERDAMYAQWRMFLRFVATRPRQELQNELAAFIPVLHALAGKEALGTTVRVVTEISEWWP